MTTDQSRKYFILNAQQRIFLDVPMDSDRFVQEGTMSADNILMHQQERLFVRGVEVFNSTSATQAQVNG